MRPGDRVVRIVSEGTGQDTHVFLEGGGVLKNVHRLVVIADAKKVNQIELFCHMSEFDIKAEVRTVTFDCPVCAEKIEHHCD